MSEISQLGKGAVKQPHDPRDLQASFVMGAVSVDWNKPVKLPNPGDEDQGSSLSCVAQAWSYYHNQVHAQNWSRRDVYSQIFLPGGGAYLRDGGRVITGPGQATRASAPDPHPETELNMRNHVDITADMEKIGIEANYFGVNGKSIDTVAATVRDFKGCIIGVEGDNAGWHDLANPQPPTNAEWGHALYCMGYHLHNGVKCIIAKSSWCSTGVPEHHLKQNYFDSGNTFDGWTLIPKEQQPMSKVFNLEYHGKLGFIVFEGFTGSAIFADSMEHYNQLNAFLGPKVDPASPVIQVPA